MRHPSVAMAFLIVTFAVNAVPAADNKSKDGKSESGKSTALVVANAAESAGAKLMLNQANNGNGGGNGGGNAGGNSAVPPGRRCDPNDPRPGCQPLPKSPKK